MKTRRLLILAFVVCFALAQTVALAGGSHGHSQVSKMAKVLIHLNHFPSGSEKNMLSKIANDSSVSQHERTIATAMINLHHKASSADKKRLSAIISDSNAPQSVRDLARIVHDLNHKPSGSDKKTLQAMIH